MCFLIFLHLPLGVPWTHLPCCRPTPVRVYISRALWVTLCLRVQEEENEDSVNSRTNGQLNGDAPQVFEFPIHIPKTLYQFFKADGAPHRTNLF